MEIKTLAFSLEVISKAKSIPIVDDTIFIWDLLISQDIEKGSFEFKDFIEALKDAVRVQMFNRIDYFDIYDMAVKKFKKRQYETKMRVIEKNMKDIEERERVELLNEN